MSPFDHCFAAFFFSLISVFLPKSFWTVCRCVSAAKCHDWNDKRKCVIPEYQNCVLCLCVQISAWFPFCRTKQSALCQSRESLFFVIQTLGVKRSSGARKLPRLSVFWVGKMSTWTSPFVLQTSKLCKMLHSKIMKRLAEVEMSFLFFVYLWGKKMRWFAWVMFSRPLIDEPSAFTLQALCCFVPPPPQPPPKKKKKKINGFV